MKLNKKTNSKDNKVNKDKDTKGFWEYSIFQKKMIPNEEQNIKILLKPENTFNPLLIDSYINPKLSREELLCIKKKNNEKISKIEEIIYSKYILDNKEMNNKNLIEIEKYGFNAKLKTKEGKIQLMIKMLETEIKKKNIDTIVNIFFKFKEQNFLLTEDIISKNKDIFNKLNNIISTIDLIEIQFLKLYSQMPPLNEKGFVKFDNWQIDVIKNIDNKVSTIVSAPTSAGKSVLTGYAVTKGRTLFVVPTDALAWQMSSYLSNILNSDVPIITLTYQSIPKRNEFIVKLNSSTAIVGTADCILDYLPLINCNFSWIIFDEIHMIGKNEGFAMESIIKVLNQTPFLALSATIGNIDEFSNWFKSINKNKIDVIICNKRFFNLQKYYYDSSEKKIVTINPLSMISLSEFEDKSILNKNLDPTPIDIWSFYQKLKSMKIDLGNLDPYIYFEKEERIELSKAIKFFNDLINFLVVNFIKYKNEIGDILNGYSNINVNHRDTSLYDIILELNKEDKMPAIIFQQNTISCLKIVRNLSEIIDKLESEKYPDLYENRLKAIKQIKIKTKKEDKNSKELTEKKELKQMLEQNSKQEEIEDDQINSPHPDFIFSKEKISDLTIKEYHEKFKIYFPNMNGDYNFLIRLLWRGIGVYTIGLPDAYLRIIQTLANKKKLAVVFSDISLVFGVSMPFRTSIIYQDNLCEDNLDSMIYHQMAGRAGRRGLDKEGNVIFAGYSWERIKELSTSFIPKIIGIDKQIFTFKNANSLCNNISNYSSINENSLLLNKNKSVLIDQISNNNDIILDNYDHNYLMWNLRYSIDSITSYYIFPYIQKYFNNSTPNNENDQIELAYFLSNFIDIKYTNNKENYLSHYLSEASKINYQEIYNLLKSKNIVINSNIDSKIWISIRNNVLVDIDSDVLRQQLFDFNTKIKAIQHYCFHNNYVILTKLLAKLLTRIWWIYHTSSPIVRLS